MRRTIATALFSMSLAFPAIAPPARAAAALTEGRSVAGACAGDALVCAFLKDGTSIPTSECQARAAGAVRILPGDCYDED